MNKFRYFFILTVFFTSIGCESPVEVDFEDEENDLVVYSLFSSDEPNILTHFDVEIYSTKSVFENDDPVFVEDANVKLKVSDDNEETLSLTNVFEHLIYRADKKPEEGKYYDLCVEKLGFKTVKSRSFVPKGVNILELNYDNITGKADKVYPGFNEYNFNVNFEIEDPEDSKNYYHLLVWYMRPFTQPDWDLDYFSVGFDDVDILKEPGITIINEANDFYGAHIKDDNFNGERKSFDFNMKFLLDERLGPEDVNIEVELRTVSEDYYRFHQEAHRLSKAGSNPFLNDPGTISNNIENGFGIFAGYATRRVRKEFK